MEVFFLLNISPHPIYILHQIRELKKNDLLQREEQGNNKVTTKSHRKIYSTDNIKYYPKNYLLLITNKLLRGYLKLN